MLSFNDKKIIALYEDGNTKAFTNQISRLLCNLSKKDVKFGDKYL
jgi:hypothetical protein